MGSFNVSCAISKLHINEDDRVALLPILRTDLAYDPRALSYGPLTCGETFTLSGGYLPVTGPIYGKYDDYGSLTDIETTPTTLFLEELFNKPITDVVSGITNSRSVYSSFSEINKIYKPDTFPELTYDQDKNKYLPLFGFTEEKKNKKVYNYRGYQLDESKAVLTTPRGSEIKLPGLAISSLESTLQIFGEHTGMWPGFAEENWNRITLLYQLGGMFYLPDFIEPVKTILEEDFLYKNANSRLIKAWEETTTYLADKTNRWLTQNPLALNLREIWGLPTEHIPNYHLMTTVDELRTMFDVVQVARATNTPLQPTYCGSQYEDIEVEETVVHIMRNILHERKIQQDW